MYSVKRVVSYMYDQLELPFEADVIFDKVVGKYYILGALSRDTDAGDPFTEFDEGEFFQFNSAGYIHYKDRPSVGRFKGILSENPRRVFYVRSLHDGYAVSHRATLKNALDIEDVAGYYIVPEDAGHKGKYAKVVVEQYSAWCEGDVWGVCVWIYDEDGELVDREHEVWGYYGHDYAESELKSTFKFYVEKYKEEQDVVSIS